MIDNDCLLDSINLAIQIKLRQVELQDKVYILRGAMAWITQKSCVALFTLWSLKTIFLFLFFLGGERQSRCESTETHKKDSKFKFDKKSCQYYDNCNSNYYLIDIKKYKNDYHNTNTNSDNNDNNESTNNSNNV